MTGNLRKAVFFILLLAVTYLAYQAIKKANTALASQKVQLNTKLDKLVELKKATATAENLSVQLEKLEEAIGFFESRLPPKRDIHKVLEQVTIIAQNQGMQPKTIRTLKEKDNSGYIEQPLRMKLVGDFNSFYSFLLELEKLPRIIKIRELELKKQNEYEGQITADFIVSIFFQNRTG